MVFYLNTFYPSGLITLNNSSSQDPIYMTPAFIRKMILFVIAAEIIVVLMLRIITLCKVRMKQREERQQRQQRQKQIEGIQAKDKEANYNQNGICQFDSAINLKQKIQQQQQKDKTKNSKNGNNSNNKNRVANLNITKKTIKQKEKQVQRKNQQKKKDKEKEKVVNIFQNPIQQIQINNLIQIQVQEQTDQTQANSPPQSLHSSNLQISLKNLSQTPSQLSLSISLILSHSFISFSTLFMYYPYILSLYVVVGHLVLVILLIGNQIFVGRESKLGRIVRGIGVSIIWVGNLGGIFLAIFGVFGGCCGREWEGFRME